MSGLSRERLASIRREVKEWDRIAIVDPRELLLHIDYLEEQLEAVNKLAMEATQNAYWRGDLLRQLWLSEEIGDKSDLDIAIAAELKIIGG